MQSTPVDKVDIDTLIVSEKLAATKMLARQLAHLHAGGRVVVAHTLFTGPDEFEFGHGHRWADFPKVQEPVYRTRSGFTGLLSELRADGELAPAVGLAAGILRPRRVVYCADADDTGAWASRRLVHWLTGSWPEAFEQTAYWPLAYDSDLARFECSPAQVREMAARKDVQRFFEANFLLNSTVLLGEAIRRTGGTSTAALSKFGLQLMYRLRELGPVAVDQAHLTMSDWGGTGRYAAGTASFGSCVSRGRLLEDLQANGLTAHERTVPGALNVQLTAAGEALLALLPKDCHDADLPWRLDGWKQEGLEAAQPKMERYLRTFFGKVKRRLA